MLPRLILHQGGTRVETGLCLLQHMRSVAQFAWALLLCSSCCAAFSLSRSLHSDGAQGASMEQRSQAVWKKSWHHLAGVSVSNQRMVHLLGSLIQYDYTLPKSQVRRGLTYYGSGHRLRRAVRKLLTGNKPMKIGLVGGSISWGQGASRRGVTDWFSVFSRWTVSGMQGEAGVRGVLRLRPHEPHAMPVPGCRTAVPLSAACFTRIYGRCCFMRCCAPLHHTDPDPKAGENTHHIPVHVRCILACCLADQRLSPDERHPQERLRARHSKSPRAPKRAYGPEASRVPLARYCSQSVAIRAHTVNGADS